MPGPLFSVAADHARTCSIFDSGHRRSINGQPGRFVPVPCNCGIES